VTRFPHDLVPRCEARRGSRGDEPPTKEITVNLAELAAKVVEAHPRVPLPMATQVLRTALKALREEIESAEPGAVQVPLLGQFRIKNVETEKDGQKQQVRRTVFIAAKPKQEGEDGDEGAGKAGTAKLKAVPA
jgi:hypothetical protein